MVTSTESVPVCRGSSLLLGRTTRAGRGANAVLQLLTPFLEHQALADLLRVARSISDPVDRGGALRSVVWQARQSLPPTLLTAIDALRSDSEPGVRALAGAEPGHTAPFTNACFFDATLERNRVVKIGGTLGVQLQRWRTEPVYVHERGLASLEQTVSVMRQSASYRARVVARRWLTRNGTSSRARRLQSTTVARPFRPAWRHRVDARDTRDGRA